MMTRRLILTAVMLMAVVSLLVATASTLVMRSYLLSQLDDQLHDQLRASLFRAGNGPGGPPGSNNFGNYDSTPSCDLSNVLGQRVGNIVVVATNDCQAGVKILGGYRATLTDDQIDELTDAAGNGSPRTVSIDGVGKFRIASTTSNGTRVIQGVPTTETDQAIARLVSIEAGLTVIGIAVAAVVGTTIVRRQMAPLAQVASTARKVTTADLSTGAVDAMPRVPDRIVESNDEVGQVGDAINQMLTHVESALGERHQSETQLRAFLADASHELRTPLATIKGYAELSRRTGADPSQSLEKVESEAHRMSALVEDMLLLARLDSGRPLERQEVDLTQLVLGAVDDARVRDPERKWRLDLPDEVVLVTGDELRLHQALTNLLTNASRHTPEGTVVTTILRDSPASITVHDNGPGVSPELQRTIFDRFTRGDSSRTRASGGAGLGMSLVRAIMAAHGGRASVTSSPGDTSFVLEFQ